MPYKNCQECNESFYTRSNKRMFCSMKCYQQNRGVGKLTISVCKNCKKQFEKWVKPSEKEPIFCSHKCYMKHKTVGDITYSCEQCGKSKTVKRTYYNKSKRHFCSVKCARNFEYPETNTIRTTIICLSCGKEKFVKYSPNSRPIPKFCSRSCTNKFYKIGNKNTAKEKIYLTCAVCGKEMVTNPARKLTKKYCSYKCLGVGNGTKRKTTNEQKVKNGTMVLRTCKYCEKEFYIHTCKVNRIDQNAGIFCSRSCTRMYNNQLYNQNKPPTSIELTIQNKLMEFGISHTTQLRQYIYLIDIAIENHKIAIECDGDYWHSLPKAKERDKRKDKYLKSKGWKVIRFSETNINNNLSWCLSILLHELNITTDT